MSTDQSTQLTRDQLLDELETLAAVEHAMVVEWLTVACALGADEGVEAVRTAALRAQDEMRHLSSVCQALVGAGRTPSLDRAGTVAGPSGAVDLTPPTVVDAAGLVAREESLATAVDGTYARLASAVAAEPDLAGAIDGGATHAAAAAELRAALGDPPSAGAIRVRRRTTDDAFEQGLLDAGDHAYGLVVALLRQWLAASDPFADGAFRQFAVQAMGHMDELDRLLVQRGLLPAFTAP